jgi:DNA repair protein RadC
MLDLTAPGQDCKQPPAPDGALSISALFEDFLIGSPIERALVAGFDHRGCLCTFLEVAGNVASVDGTIGCVRQALASLAVSHILLAHNHPCGTPFPSAADRATTRNVAALARLAGARLDDHLLYAGGGVVSFRQLGLL